MENGGHWGCLLKGGVTEDSIVTMVHKTIDKGKYFEAAPLPDWPSEEKSEVVVAYTYPEGDLQSMLLFRSDHKKKQLRAVTAYPFSSSGIKNTIVIREIVEWENRVEAQIKASTLDGAEVSFFDTLYFKNREVYKTYGKYDFVFSAFGYYVEKATPDHVEVTNPDTLRVMRAIEEKIPEDEVTDLSPIRVSLDKSTILTEIKGGAIDDFAFRATAKNIGEVKFEDHKIFKIETTLIGTDNPFNVYLYVGEHSLQAGYIPQKDDDLTGSLWLQGYLCVR